MGFLVVFDLFVGELVFGGGALEGAAGGGVGNGVHADGENDVENDHFAQNRPDGSLTGAGDGGHHDTRHVGDGFDAGKRQDDVDEHQPLMAGTAARAVDVMPALGEVRDGENREDNGENQGGHGDDQGKGAGLFGTNVIDQANKQNTDYGGEGAPIFPRGPDSACPPKPRVPP